MTPSASLKAKVTRRAPVSSVRLRLALLNVIVLALALVGFGVLVRQQVASDLNTNIDRSLVLRAQGMPHWTSDRIRHIRERRNSQQPPPPPDDKPPKRNELDARRPRIVDKTGRSAFGGPDKTIRAWDVAAVQRCLQTGQPARTLEHILPRYAQCVAFAPDGAKCVVGGSNKQFIAFDVDLSDPPPPEKRSGAFRR